MLKSRTLRLRRACVVAVSKKDASMWVASCRKVSSFVVRALSDDHFSEQNASTQANTMVALWWHPSFLHWSQEQFTTPFNVTPPPRYSLSCISTLVTGKAFSLMQINPYVDTNARGQSWDKLYDISGSYSSFTVVFLGSHQLCNFYFRKAIIHGRIIIFMHWYFVIPPSHIPMFKTFSTRTQNPILSSFYILWITSITWLECTALLHLRLATSSMYIFPSVAYTKAAFWQLATMVPAVDQQTANTGLS